MRYKPMAVHDNFTLGWTLKEGKNVALKMPDDSEL